MKKIVIIIIVILIINCRNKLEKDPFSYTIPEDKKIEQLSDHVKDSLAEIDGIEWLK